MKPEITEKPHKANIKSKLKAILLITVIISQCFALLITAGIIRPISASTEIYSVENTIYMNVTEPWVGPSAEGDSPSMPESKIISITIKDNGEVHSSGHQVHILEEGGNGFAPDAQQALMGLQTSQQALDPGVSGVLVGDHVTDLTSAQRMLGGVYSNGSWVLRDPTTHNYGIMDPLASPVIRKSVLFDTPQNYAETFCAANSYTLLNVVNSTYEETVNTNLMNLQQVKGDQHELYIIQYSSELNASSMETQIAPIIIAVVIIVVVVSIAIIAVSAASVINMPGLLALEQRKLDAWLSDQAIAEEGENARAAQDNLLEWEQYCLGLYANNSITWEELQAMLNVGGAPYRDVISNASTNIQNILDQYYEHEVDFSQYGAGFAFSWTDIWFWIIVAIIAGFGIYIVYVFIKRWGNKKEIKVVSTGVI